MQNNKWVPQVLKDVEKFCRENGLLEVVPSLEEARRTFKLLEDEKISATVRESENVEQIRLVWSQTMRQVKSG